MKLYFKKLFLLTLSLFLFAITQGVQAVGVSPGNLDIDNLLKGSEIESKFVLSRMDLEKDLAIEVTKQGEIADWINFEKGTSFIYPAGQKQFTVNFTLRVPEDAAIGSYSGTIRFMGQAALPESEGASVGIATGAISKITLTVVNKRISNFEVLGIGINKAKIGEDLVFQLKLLSKGNVPVQPGHLEVDLFDKYRKREFGSFETNKFLGFVSAKETGKVLATIPYKPRVAGYMWAKVRVFDYEGNRISPDEKEDIIFEVMPGRGFSIMPFVILISTCLLLVGTIYLLLSRVKKEYGFKITWKVKTWKGKTNKTSRAKRKKQKTVKTKQKAKKRKGK